MNLETQALVNYYEKRFHKGWHYGYIYPAMNKALQAAGRVIRTPTDEGIIVLLDNRYTHSTYKELLTPHAHICFDAQPFENIKRVLERKECQKGVNAKKRRLHS